MCVEDGEALSLLWITTSPESATLYIGCGQHRFCTWAHRAAIAYGKSTSGSAMGTKILAAMQEHRAGALVIPDSFLGDSALDAGLPKLLLFATHLVYLRLSNTPHSGYISPEAIVAPLRVVQSRNTFPSTPIPAISPLIGKSQCPPPSRRSVIPALDYFRFMKILQLGGVDAGHQVL
jgi:hypothetical protein